MSLKYRGHLKTTRRWATWQQHHPIHSKWLDNEPAVYVVYVGNQVAYVGSTTDIRKRLTQHGFAWKSGAYQTPWGPVMSLWVKYSPSIRYGDWVMRELRLIRRLKPPLNKINLGMESL